MILLVLDVGSKDGILVGDIVFAYGNIPLGKVSEVYAKIRKLLYFQVAEKKQTLLSVVLIIYIDLIRQGGGNFEIILLRDFTLKKVKVSYFLI